MRVAVPRFVLSRAFVGGGFVSRPSLTPLPGTDADSVHAATGTGGSADERPQSDLDACDDAFARWREHGAQRRGVIVDGFVGAAFRHGWDDEFHHRSDFNRRQYVGDDRDAYMSGRFLCACRRQKGTE